MSDAQPGRLDETARMKSVKAETPRTDFLGAECSRMVGPTAILRREAIELPDERTGGNRSKAGNFAAVVARQLARRRVSGAAIFNGHQLTIP